jgi:hypothetical protein
MKRGFDPRGGDPAGARAATGERLPAATLPRSR